MKGPTTHCSPWRATLIIAGAAMLLIACNANLSDERQSEYASNLTWRAGDWNHGTCAGSDPPCGGEDLGAPCGNEWDPVEKRCHVYGQGETPRQLDDGQTLEGGEVIADFRIPVGHLFADPEWWK